MISIITVVKNGVATIERTILSVVNQDYLDYEYIVIDGVSSDGTLTILNKYSDSIAKIVSEPDKGIYDAMNKGISLAKGEWIYFLGCDDVLYNNSLLSDIFLSTQYKDYDIVYGNVLFLGNNVIYDGEFDYEKLCNRSICHQAIFYRKELFEINGCFDTRYVNSADYVFNVILFCSNNKWLYINKIIAIYNEKGTSFRSKDKNFLNDSFAIRYDNFRPFVSKYVLSRIFWSSFFRYSISHNILNSFKYISLVFKDIGPIRLLTYLLLIGKNKSRKLF